MAKVVGAFYDFCFFRIPPKHLVSLCLSTLRILMRGLVVRWKSVIKLTLPLIFLWRNNSRYSMD